MKSDKVNFTNKQGQELVGKISLPVDQKPHNFVIFAHCFTCTKNLIAIRNLSNALTSHGFGVLRFDFAGLGESEGDFAETNFSGNIQDLIAAANYLKEKHIAPSLLIGHSLGGAAVLFAASMIDSVTAVATIGAPSEPIHVKNLIQDSVEEISEKGHAKVSLGGRPFTIKKQFLDDLENNSLLELVADLRKPFLILHSPQDRVVTIENAEKLFKAAFHPKSFITLDQADHLLSRKEDSLYVGEVIASWASRYVEIPEIVELDTKDEVVASLAKEDNFLTRMKVGSHYMLADEPLSVGGNDFGPNPFELVTAGLSACTAMTLHMYARRKEWDLQNVHVHISHTKERTGDIGPKQDVFTRHIEMKGELDVEQREKLIEIANKCPVHKTLHQTSKVVTFEKK
ncbi:alpha/beta fold hydrolase [Mesonia ostreae]|uniref:Alpha/beta fold hydrolase n=1 Tax=Mesonia ostreae TaxID=861110 RepID=A0ABU2KGZ3_9FLAO|nr:alpha/beta fold hydrolase [Mesonia ostreae]MDT0293983.1 alpha/beta fold hydrolase [Mesonia ostreae]